jgi:hypothetical protein
MTVKLGAKKDDNGYPTIFGLSCVDGVTPTRIYFNPTNRGMLIDTTTVISVTPTFLSAKDANDMPVAKGVSSTDGVTVLPWYVNPSTGAVLADILI